MSELMGYLPPYYEGSPESRTIQKAFQPEIDELWRVRDDLQAQLNPNTATWGLALWEQALGILVNESRPLSLRRSAVISKLRGVGAVTAEMLKGVAEAFTHSPVTVLDLPRESWVWLRFELLDIPAYFPELQAALLEIIPAHLGFTLEGVIPAPFTEASIDFSLHRFTQRIAMSSLWREPLVRFGGSILFGADVPPLPVTYSDGSLPFNGVKQFGRVDPPDGIHCFDQAHTLTHWTGFTVSAAMPLIRERVVAALTIDNLYGFDGSARFNGARRFDASITQEVFQL